MSQSSRVWWFPLKLFTAFDVVNATCLNKITHASCVQFHSHARYDYENRPSLPPSFALTRIPTKVCFNLYFEDRIIFPFAILFPPLTNPVLVSNPSWKNLGLYRGISRDRVALYLTVASSWSRVTHPSLITRPR